MRTIGVTACIPCYNEKKRIGHVIRSLIRCRYVSNIICVDDGSTDDTLLYIRRYFSAVTCITTGSNRGKSEAVSEAARLVHTPYILLIDADLRAIFPEQIDTAIQLLQNDPELDAIIFRMLHFCWTSTVLHHDILLSGNCLVKTSDLITMIDTMHPTGYELEICLCQYLFIHGKRVRFLPFSAEGVDPIKKNGVWWVIKRDLRLYTAIMRRVGIQGMLHLMFDFCRTG